MNEHTPGPWALEYSQKTICDQCAIYATSEERGKFCILSIAGLPRAEEATANANLITAAPDLLEALETLLNQYLSAPCDATFGDGIINQEKAVKAIERARAVPSSIEQSEESGKRAYGGRYGRRK